MLASVELEDKRIWIEYSLVVDEHTRVYDFHDLKVVEVVEEFVKIEIESTIEERELASMIIRDVAYMVNELELERDEIIKRIADSYGMDEYDAKQFVDYAEHYLFS